MKTWIRLHTDLPRNRKLQSLPGSLFKLAVNCWAFAGWSEDSKLPDSDRIAWELRENPAKIKRQLSQLVEARVLYEHDGCLFPMNWEERQFCISKTTERTRAFRERSGNVSGTFRERSSRASVSVSVSESESVSESVEKRKAEIAEIVTHELGMRVDALSQISMAELEAAWDRWAKRPAMQNLAMVAQRINSMGSKFDAARFRTNLKAYCDYRDRRGWDYETIGLYGWLDAGMPPPPPEPIAITRKSAAAEERAARERYFEEAENS